MVGVTAEGYNWDFIWQNIQFFIGESRLWYFFPLLLFATLLSQRKKYRVLGFYPYLIFSVTVCNPWLIEIAGSVIGLTDRYYRFFWILPLGLTIGVTAAFCMKKCRRPFVKVAIYLATAVFVMALGSPAYIGAEAPEYLKTETEYYDTERVVHISSEIHKHGLDQPVIICPEELLYDLCQYDFQHISAFGRGEVIYLMNQFSLEYLDQLIQENNYELILKYVFLSGQVDRLSAEKLREALTNYHIDYFVIPESQSTVIPYYEAAGCVVSGQVDGYFVVYTQLR